MLALIFIAVGFLLGIWEGLHIGLLGAMVGYCCAQMLAYGKELRQLRDTVRQLQRQSPADTSAPTEEPARPEPPPPPDATPAIVQETAPVYDDAWAASVFAGAKSPADDTQEPGAAQAHEPPVSQEAAETRTAPVFAPLAAAWAWLFGGNTLVRVGVVVLFFGLAFLIRFAAEHTTLPVELRYTGVAAAAIAALILGWRLRERKPGYAMTLQGFGVAVLYLTLFAGYRLHQLFPAGMVMALLVATCVLSALLAILQNARALAVVGICGGFLAPVLASTGSGNHVELFSYYALLNAAIFAIAWFKAWRPLNVLGFLFTFGIGSVWGARSYRDELFASTEPFLILFFLSYLAIALLYGRRRQEELAAVTIDGERVDYVDGTLIFGVPVAAFSLQYLMVRDMPMGSAISALVLAAIYLPLAAVLYRRGAGEMRLFVESFLALGVIFLSLAIPLAFDAQWTSAAWAAEGAGIFWVCCRQNRPAGRLFALLLQFGAGLGFLRCLERPGSMSWLGMQTVLDGPVLGAILVGTAGFITGRLARRHGLGNSADDLGMLWGLFFINIVPALLLDFQWSAVTWALAGFAAVWIGLHHRRAAAPLFGLLQQVFAGVIFFRHAQHGAPEIAVLNAWWLGCFAFVVAGFGSGLALARRDQVMASRVALIWSLLWWSVAGIHEIDLFIRSSYELTAAIVFFGATALLLIGLARRLAWATPCSASIALVPALCLCALVAYLEQSHPAARYGGLAWPFALGAAAFSLHRQQGGLPHRLQACAHILMLWLLALLGAWEGVWCFRELGATGSAWPLLGGIVAPLFLLWLLSRSVLQTCWPLAAFTTTYRIAAAPVAFGVWLWLVVNNFYSTGDAAPLPYLPLLNPLDIGSAACLLVLLMWLRRVLADVEGDTRLIGIGLGLSTFLWLNGMLLRSLHHWAGVPFDFDVMMHSTLVQAAFSLFWALLALSLMLTATRRHRRPLWWTGGGLMALVVIKLFLVDLSRVGSVERIVSFIGVGLLLLIIGYFSPMPPKQTEDVS